MNKIEVILSKHSPLKIMYRSEIENWAIHHGKQARLVLAVSEIGRLTIAFLLGAGLGFGFDLNEVLILVIAVISLFLVAVKMPISKRNFSLFLPKAVVLFLCSWLLAGLGGTLLHGSEGLQTGSQQLMAGDQTTGVKSGLLDEVVENQEKKIPEITMKTRKVKAGLPGWVRLIYVLGFLVSLVLTYYSLILACSLSCSGYGFFAVLAFIMAFGVLSTGIYFLIKAFRKKAKPYRQMEKKERKKEWKNFFLTWLVTSAVIALTILIGNLAGG
jgi:hypothetical protein